MRQMLQSLQPESLDDIIAAIALYRPGPMDSIPTFIECRHDPARVRYATPLLEPILRSTYGCVVYQEQVMSIFREIGGYTFGHADVVRRAMSKKKADVLLSERDAFVSGAETRGVDRAVAEQLFTDMESFANYAFNKSHAAAYAVISYRTAYLLAHYPQQYFSALLTSVLGSQTKIAEYIAECASRGICVLPPDINESRMHFSTDGKNIRFGLLALKNVGAQFLQNILSERRHGRFTSFENFVQRMPAGELNKRMVEALIKGGAFDRLGVYRSRLLAVYEMMIESAVEKSRNNLAGQLDMFSMMTGASEFKAPSVAYPEIPELGVREKLMMEKEAAGMYFSGNMLDEYDKHLSLLETQPISELVGEDSDPVEKQYAVVAGMITSVTVKNTKNGDRMAFFTLEDRLAEIECVVFARQFSELQHMIRADVGVAVSGTVSLREDEPAKILVNRMELLVENNRFRPEDVKPMSPSRQTRVQAATAVRTQNDPSPARTAQAAQPSVGQAKRLFLRVPDARGRAYQKAKNLLEIFDGEFPTFFFYADEKRYETVPVGIAISDYVLRQLRDLLGNENVILK